MSESQKGGPASREFSQNAGGQETVTKGAGRSAHYAERWEREWRWRNGSAEEIAPDSAAVRLGLGLTAHGKQSPAIVPGFYFRSKPMRKRSASRGLKC